MSAASLMPFVEEAIQSVHTDGWPGYVDLYIKRTKKLAHELMPRVHRVAALLKRWILGTHQGSISGKHIDYYLDEFTFRFNRRTSRHRGKLFFRTLPIRLIAERPDLCLGLPEVVNVVARAREVHLPLIVVAEQRAGFAHGARRAENEATLAAFLRKDGVFVISPDEQTTFFYADLYAYLRRKGRPIPTNDLWIASIVVQHNLALFDRDAGFDNLPQVARIQIS